ncbi:MAG: hypothetical protein AAB966_04675 [Patescibacteria group bacterium]
MTYKERFTQWYKTLPDKKQYIELVTALLSIPVLLTVIILNLNNLQGGNNKDKTDSSNNVTIIPVEVQKGENDQSPTITPIPQTTAVSCKKEVGPVSILFPQENQTVTQDPVCIDISYKAGEYCGVVWTYRINGGGWSDFTDKSICLYNLSSGQKKVDHRVRSIASSDEEILQRNFTYQNPTATGSATTQ